MGLPATAELAGEADGGRLDLRRRMASIGEWPPRKAALLDVVGRIVPARIYTNSH